ncbi:filamentous hemagglutinin, partial [Pseudomonas asturiensis]
RTGNVEVAGPDGTLYLQTADGGLTPKAGGNLAQLVKAEREIAGPKEVASPDATGGKKVGPETDLAPEVNLHSDGSYRTPDGKFASPKGLAPPGTVKADEFAKHLEANGMEVVGTEMVVKGPLGDRRYDIVVRDANGKLHGLEVKSGTASKTSHQEFTDYFVNQFGAQGKGRLKGEVIESATTVYVP